MRQKPEEEMTSLPTVEVGATVGVRFATEIRPAWVLEDRGNLAGERVVRIRVRVPPDEEVDIDWPVSALVAWPPPETEKPSQRVRRRRTKIGRTPTPA